MSAASLTVLPPPAELAQLYKRAQAAGMDKPILDWRWRQSSARARIVLAESRLKRAVPAMVHELEQELTDAAGAYEFCRLMIRALERGPL